jgi:hypothetical protein
METTLSESTPTTFWTNSTEELTRTFTFDGTIPATQQNPPVCVCKRMKTKASWKLIFEVRNLPDFGQQPFMITADNFPIIKQLVTFYESELTKRF